MIHDHPVFTSAVFMLVTSSPAFAQNATNTIIFPPFTLSSTETAGLNIMSAAAEFPGWTLVGTCQAVVSFYRADGSVAGEPTTFTLQTKTQVFSALLPWASAGLDTSPAVVSAQVVLTNLPVAFSTGTPPLPPCTLALSLETFDSVTGVTHLVIPGKAEVTVTEMGSISILPCIGPLEPAAVYCGARYSFEPLPSQVTVIPPVGLSSTETIEIDITSAAAGYTTRSADACDGSITFYGPDSSALASPVTFTLAKTTRSFLTKTTESFSARLPYSALNTKVSRPEISAQISLTALPAEFIQPFTGGLPLPCIAAFSAKTFDNATGVVYVNVAGSTAPETSSMATTGSSSPRPSRAR